MRLIDWIALGMLGLALLVCVWMVFALLARARWDRNLAHDKALIDADSSGDLWARHRRL